MLSKIEKRERRIARYAQGDEIAGKARTGKVSYDDGTLQIAKVVIHVILWNHFKVVFNGISSEHEGENLF